MSKRCFEGLLHSGKPEMDAAYGIWSLPFIVANSYAGWSDTAGMPTTAWYDNVAESYTNARGYLLLDHEAWPITTSQERQTNASRFVTIYQAIKSRRPDLKIGFYAFPTVRNFWDTIGNDADASPGGASYVAWQAQNDDFAAMWAVIDYAAPTIYYPYDTVTNGYQDPAYVYNYYHANILDTIRCRTAYGHGQPIYPYVHMRSYVNNLPLDIHLWELQTRTAYLEADGMILWGGYLESWAENTAWWGRFLMAFPFGDRTVIKPRAVRN